MSFYKKSILGLLTTLLLAGCMEGVNESLNLASDEQRSEDFETINGNARLKEGAVLDGDIDIINGRVTVGDNASVLGAITTINGSVRFGKGAKADKVTTINGAIRGEESVVFDGDVETINGSISFQDDSRFGGDVSAINGFIELFNVSVEDNVRNYSGGIHLDEGTQVGGDVLVKKPDDSDGFNISFGENKPPLIIIGKDVVVKGDLVFERKVRLYIHESASHGRVEGAKPNSYSGDEPPESHE